MATREEKLEQLVGLFGSEDLTRSVLDNVLDANKEVVEDAVDELLLMTKDVTGRPKPKEAVKDAFQEAPAETVDVAQRLKNVATIHQMFGGDLTQSVINTVYEQNKGDVAQAVDMLLDIYHDEEAIEAIRTMGTQQKKKLEEDMKAEQEQRVTERQAQLMREIEEEKKRVKEIEQKQIEEEKMREKEYNERIAKLRKQREEEEKELREIELKRKEAELAAREAGEKVKQAELDALRRAQKEREAELAEQVERQVRERAKAEEQLRLLKVEREQELAAKKEDIKNKELLVSRIIEQAALVTLGVRYGAKTVVVSWSLGKDMKGQAADWIGFYKLGQPNTKYRQYIKTGSHHFPAPKTPGLYQFKYFGDGSYNEIATSDVIHIGPQISLSAKIVHGDNEKTRDKSKVIVTFTLQGGQLGEKDWFALYEASEKHNRNYLATRYVQPSDIENGSAPVTFTWDAPRPPGDYVVRFIPSRCKYTHVAQSNAFRVENRDSLTTDLEKDDNGRVKNVIVNFEIHSAEATSSDYIALYKAGRPNYYYERFEYVDPTKKAICIKAPTEVGSYDVRYHSASHSKHTDLIRSSPFSIENSDILRAEISGGIVTVSWDIHSVPTSKWDWVGLFAKNSDNRHYVVYKYIPTSAKATVFEVPKEPGVYNVRYFSSQVGKYEDFRKSEDFVVA